MQGLAFRSVLSVLALTLTVPAMADSATHVVCDAAATVDVATMGAATEAVLQQHIDELQARLHRVVTPRQSRVAGLAQRQQTKQHLAQMQDAMVELHTAMYERGCTSALHGVPVEQRLAILERRLAEQAQTAAAGR